VAELAAETAQEVTAAVNAGRLEAGLDMLDEPDDVLLRPPVLLYLTAVPFEYPRPSWPASFRLVGPCPWEPPTPPLTWLADDPRPVVLVSTSTEYQDDGRLVTTAFAALSGRQDLLVLATAPAADTPDHDSPPPNCRIERFAAHRELLTRAVAVICHGGMGITQKALAAGVPVCAVPFGRDQLEVARRLEVSGAGTRLPAPDLTADALALAVEQAIAMRPQAESLAQAFAAAGGPAAAASAVEQLTAPTPGPRTG
jgi:MGT family glycosyltransferase